MKKRLLLLVGVIGAGLVFSGCATWFLSGASLSDVKLTPGEKTVLTVGTHPMNIAFKEGNDVRSYPFFLLAVPDDGALTPAGPKRFDVTGKFTNSGLPLVQNNDLRDYLIGNQDECGTIPLDEANTTYRVFTTERRVNDQSKPQLKAISKLGIRQSSLADTTFAQVGVAVGSADLNNDGDYADSLCTGGAALALHTKAVPAPRGMREQLRSLNNAVNE